MTMMNARIRRRYAVCTALVIGALLIGCSHQPDGTTEITIFPGTEPMQTVATEPLVEATGDTTPTESVTATDTVTEPPATEPPATEPPATEPPATEPPATEPPATEPPATEPPATEPPATEPPATEPPATEPPPTEPPATEPPPTEPPATEPPATESPATEPPATDPPPTEPPATEPPATEPEIILDYDTAMAYGNQYAADTYGYYIDLSLNADNAGFEFPYSASVHGIIAKGGQDYLHLRIARKVDSLAESLSARGISKAYISCYIYEDADGIVQFYVYYG